MSSTLHVHKHFTLYYYICHDGCTGQVKGVDELGLINVAVCSLIGCMFSFSLAYTSIALI